MTRDPARWMILTALVFALLACTASCEDVGVTDQKATAKLAPEIEKLAKKYPLAFEVQVVVVSKQVYGWFQAVEWPANRIVVQDRGHSQNVRTLRHEWCHARQKSEGKPYNEEEAYAAEREE